MPVERLQLILSDDVAVVVDDGRVEAEHYQALEGALLLCHRKRKHRIGLIVIIPGGATVPSAATRGEITAFYERTASILCAVVHVVQETGFQGAVSRAVLTSLMLLQRKPYETSVFSNIRSAIRWMGAHVAKGGGRIGLNLESSVAELRVV
jgi:hypothetical protein